jgi:hypothetical protein
MTSYLLSIPLFITLLLSNALPVFHTGETSAAIYLSPSPCDTIPELNQKIIVLVRQQIGTTVGRGECWDLAALVLNQFGAKWDKKYGFGRKVDPEKECVYPGDLVQFEGVKIKYTVGPRVYTETMAHHTAVINEVKAKRVYVLAHQNTGTSGRKVGLSDLDLKTIIKGTFQIYRPVM